MNPTGPLPAMLEKLRDTTMVVWGDLMLDTYLFGRTSRLSREAPVVVVQKEGEEHRLGGAANTAANIAALGASVTLFGAVGTDPAGDTLLKLLEKAGVNTGHLLRRPEPTAIKTRVLAGATGTTRQQVLRIDEDSQSSPPPATEKSLLQALELEMSNAQGLVISDYGHGMATAGVGRLGAALHQAQKVVCADSRAQLSEFRDLSAVTPNHPEAEALVGFAIDGPKSYARAGEAILEKLGAAQCLLTLGKKGMSLFQAEGAPDTIDVVGPDQVTDVTGAGDTVIAAYATATAAGIPPGYAMRLANYAASIVVEKLGTASATPTALLDRAKRYPIEWP